MGQTQPDTHFPHPKETYRRLTYMYVLVRINASPADNNVPQLLTLSRRICDGRRGCSEFILWMAGEGPLKGAWRRVSARWINNNWRRRANEYHQPSKERGLSLIFLSSFFLLICTRDQWKKTSCAIACDGIRQPEGSEIGSFDLVSVAPFVCSRAKYLLVKYLAAQILPPWLAGGPRGFF
jgi:hypothetical protein